MPSKLAILVAGTVVATLSSGSARAQSGESFGVVGGIGVSQFSESRLRTSSETGFSIGFAGEAPLGRHVSVEAQPRFDRSRQGFYVSSTTAAIGAGGAVVPVTTQERATATLDTLELPLLVKVRFGTGFLEPYVFAGPSVGWVVSSRVKLAEYTAGPDPRTNDLAVALDLGAGLRYPLSPVSTLRFDAEYVHGLTKVFSSTGVDSDAKRRGFRVLLGVSRSI